jgi:hypothetical protein
VAAAATGFLAFRGGDPTSTLFVDLPSCELEDMRSQTTTETVDGVTRFAYVLTLREPDWYEGMFRTLRLSDRDVESPCRLETTIRVEVGVLLPIADWPPERGPAPLRMLEAVETEPASPIEAPVRTRLVLGEQVLVLFVDITNWCQGASTPGISIMTKDAFDPNVFSGLSGPLGSTPPCVDPSRSPGLVVTPAGPP